MTKQEDANKKDTDTQKEAKAKHPQTRAYSHLVYKVEHRLSGEIRIYRGADAKHIHDKTMV